jgi:seryl-tRNA(Sec) selenium transferase
MTGFVEEPALADLAAVAHEANLPLVLDLGSGATFDTTTITRPARIGAYSPSPGTPGDGRGGGQSEQRGERPHPDPPPEYQGRERDLEVAEREPTPADSLAAGADLVCFSGDKLLGGPQAGIIAGSAAHIAALKKQPMFRALRCDKLVLSALEATVDQLLAGGESELPIRAMASADLKSLQSRADKIVAHLRAAGISATVGGSEARIGGGSLPRTVIPSVTIDLQSRDPQALAARLRAGDPPVIGYVAAGTLKLDLRTVFPRQDAHLIAAVRSALAQP